MMSLQRRQQQEESRVRKEAEMQARREKEKAKDEEKQRRKEEQAARRQAILEQHKMKKAFEEAEREVRQQLGAFSAEFIYKHTQLSSHRAFFG